MGIENKLIYVKQFNKEFESELKGNKEITPTLLRMYHDYIEQTFKSNNLYDKVLGKIIETEEELGQTLTDKQKDFFDKWETYRDEMENLTAEQSFIYGYCLDKELSLEKQRIKSKLKDEQNSNDNFFYNYIDSIMQFIEDNRFNIWSKTKDYKEITDKMRAIKNKYPNVRTFVEDRQVVDLTKEELKAVLEYISLDDDIERLEKIETFKLGIKEGISF